MSHIKFATGVIVSFALVIAFGGGTAVAQTTLTVLHDFNGLVGSTDGAGPNNNLLRTSTGALYGATQYGGGSTGGGTVYSLTASGVETVLHSFTGGTDGFEPQSNVTRDTSGNLYGTTTLGGAYNSGIVYKIAPNGKETILYTFTGGADGGFPVGGVARDSSGNLYGATYGGGANNLGVIYEIESTGQETVLHSFDSSSGSQSWATLLRDAEGNLYGTGGGGADNEGVVFKLSAAGTYSTVYSFQNNGKDGESPDQNLLMDSAGNIFGMTRCGGTHDEGTIYKIEPNGAETVLHSFGAKGDGSTPFFGLAQDAKGNLYGSSQDGGAYGCGTVFKFTPSTHTMAILYSFSGPYGVDGSTPFGGVVLDSLGNVHGTAYNGGPYNDGGVVFELSFP